jgi:hypothetical protein
MVEKDKKAVADEKVETNAPTQDSPGKAAVPAEKDGDVESGSDLPEQKDKKGSSGSEEKDFTD